MTTPTDLVADELDPLLAVTPREENRRVTPSAASSTGAGDYFYPCSVCSRRIRGTGQTKCLRCTNALKIGNGTEAIPPAEWTFDSRRLGKYGITEAQFRGLFEEQDGRCAICRTQAAMPTDLVVDHNHANGEVRGLLCYACNSGLGLLKDSPDVLDAAMAYLEERGCYGPNTQEAT